MSSSSLLRSEAVAVINPGGFGSSTTAPRIFGARVLRGDRVGIDRPISLSVPVTRLTVVANDDELGTDTAAPAAPDFGVIEEAARLQGYNIGFEQGQAAGLAAAEEAMGQAIARLAQLVDNIHESHTAFFRAAERQVVDLALQIAQKVIEREVENMPDLAVGVIRSALEEMDARTAIRVRVNPDDVELLKRRWTQVVPPGIGAERIELQPDERVHAGGGVIETLHGTVDAQLDTKLSQLGNALWTFVMDENEAQADGDESDA